MNVVLAVVLLSIQAGIGSPTLATQDNAGRLHNIITYVTNVDNNSPAAETGIAPLDRIVRINEIQQPSPEQLRAVVAERAGQPILIEVERGGKHLELTIQPRVHPPDGQGPLGVHLAATGLDKVSWWRAPFEGIQRTWQMLMAIVSQFWLIITRLVRHGIVGETLTGPVGIAIYTNEVTQLGLPYVLEFGALISLNLAIINILPFPALDGGRIMFVLLEKLRGKRLAARFEQITHTIGFVILIGLMILITLRDIKRFF